MSWADALRSILFPCDHQWEKIGELKDREENPAAATMVLACKRCGQMKEQLFVSMSCPPHKWNTISKVRVIGDEQTRAIHEGRMKREDVIQKYEEWRQQCERCGELRMVKM